MKIELLILTSVKPLFQKERLNLSNKPVPYWSEFELFDPSVLLNANPISCDKGEQFSTMDPILLRSDQTSPLNGH